MSDNVVHLSRKHVSDEKELDSSLATYLNEKEILVNLCGYTFIAVFWDIAVIRKFFFLHNGNSLFVSAFPYNSALWSEKYSTLFID